jgi:HEAT repeat protein
MVRNANPLARAAAAFAVGQIADANCAPILEGLLRDSDPGVRGEALRSLIRFRRQDRTLATAEPGTAEAPVDASAPLPAS